jgi:Zn-dependent protease with chaperone function
MKLSMRRAGPLPSALKLMVAAACCLATLGSAPAGAAPPPLDSIPPAATPREIQLGDQAVAEIAKDPKIKFLDLKIPANKALSDKLNAMAAILGKVSLRPLIKYQVRIIDDKDINAFTVPNGHIYVYRGLTEAAGSDDELASVLAHEIGHNCMMHALRAQQKAKPLNWLSIAALLAALSGRSGADIAQMTPYLVTGIMNGYTIEYEKEADHCAIDELAKTTYNPSALVTFMNRMSDEEMRSPEIQLGIFQTHPTSPERASAALAQLAEKHIAFTPRDVSGGAQATVEAASPQQATVQWGKQNLFEINTPAGAATDAKTLATRAAKQLNDLMRANLHLFEITAEGDDQGATLSARGIVLTHISPADAQLQKMSPLALAQKWKANFTRLFWSETMKGNL